MEEVTGAKLLDSFCWIRHHIKFRAMVLASSGTYHLHTYMVLGEGSQPTQHLASCPKTTILWLHLSPCLWLLMSYNNKLTCFSRRMLLSFWPHHMEKQVAATTPPCMGSRCKQVVQEHPWMLVLMEKLIWNCVWVDASETQICIWWWWIN